MVQSFIKKMVEDTIGSAPFEIGDVVQHPDGHDVQIVDGQYWGTSGLSNFWYWRRVLDDGGLADEVEHGYGWQPEPTSAPSPR